MEAHDHSSAMKRTETFRSDFTSDEKLPHDRKAESLPWIVSPLKYSSGDDLYFHPREQASMIELFFDLFFVANLATFTAVHGIVDLDTLWAYLGFFTVIWFTWLQITIHDVRFAIDSFYERMFKSLQFLVFVGFALAGYNFEPGSQQFVYETLCLVLFFSRLILTIQYTVVLVYVTKSNSRLVKPMIFVVGTFVLTSGCFLAMIIASHTGLSSKIYYTWYILSFLEAVSILAISGTWNSLGFGKTHLLERMGLLSMIVVGEGVIGVTKTIGKTMGANGPDFRCFLQIVAVIAILMYLWQSYFDNQPHEGQHLGAVREIFWVAMHFPLHIAFVGIVEGANQLVIAWKTWTYFLKFNSVTQAACANHGISGQSLTATLNYTIGSFKFYKYAYSATIIPDIKRSLEIINNTVNPCSTDSASNQFSGSNAMSTFKNGTTTALQTLTSQVLGGLYLNNGYSIPEFLGDIPKPTAAEVFYSAYFIVFGYVFISLAIMFASSAITIYFVRMYRKDVFEYIRIGIRLIAMIVCIIIANVRATVMPPMRDSGMNLTVMVIIILSVVLVDCIATRVVTGMAKGRGTRGSIQILHVDHEEIAGGAKFHMMQSKSFGEESKHVVMEHEVREIPRPDSALANDRFRSMKEVIHRKIEAESMDVDGPHDEKGHGSINSNYF